MVDMEEEAPDCAHAHETRRCESGSSESRDLGTFFHAAARGWGSSIVSELRCSR